MEKTGIYQQFNDACHKRGLKISNVLKSIGCSTGVTGGWKAGQYPRLDIAMMFAEYLDVSLDELCYGTKKARQINLTKEQKEWLSIIEMIPDDKREMCKDFIKTHAAIPVKAREKTS